jgi:MFS family permease
MIGRRVAVMITWCFVMGGSIGSSLCQRSETFPLVSQVILGIGIGGEYALTATIASECADPALRTRIVGGVFSMGFVRCGLSMETSWRLLLGLGAVPYPHQTRRTGRKSERRRRDYWAACSVGFCPTCRATSPSETVVNQALFGLVIALPGYSLLGIRHHPTAGIHDDGDCVCQLRSLCVRRGSEWHILFQ